MWWESWLFLFLPNNPAVSPVKLLWATHPLHAPQSESQANIIIVLRMDPLWFTDFKETEIEGGKIRESNSLCVHKHKLAFTCNFNYVFSFRCSTYKSQSISLTSFHSLFLSYFQLDSTSVITEPLQHVFFHSLLPCVWPQLYRKFIIFPVVQSVVALFFFKLTWSAHPCKLDYNMWHSNKFCFLSHTGIILLP